MSFGDVLNAAADLFTGSEKGQEPSCPHCGKKASDAPTGDVDPYQAAGDTLSKGAQGPSGQAFQANNPFK